MAIDKAQRYDAAVAGLRDMVERADATVRFYETEARDAGVKRDAARDAREAMQRLLDDLLREPPEPAHIEEALPVVEPVAVDKAHCSVCGEWNSLIECNRKNCPHRWKHGTP